MNDPQSTQVGRAQPDEPIYPTLTLISIPARSQFKYYYESWFSRNPKAEPKEPGKTYFPRTMKPSFDFYQSLRITKHKRYRPTHASGVRPWIPETR